MEISKYYKSGVYFFLRTDLHTHTKYYFKKRLWHAVAKTLLSYLVGSVLKEVEFYKMFYGGNCSM